MVGKTLLSRPAALYRVSPLSYLWISLSRGESGLFRKRSDENLRWIIERMGAEYSLFKARPPFLSSRFFENKCLLF